MTDPDRERIATLIRGSVKVIRAEGLQPSPDNCVEFAARIVEQYHPNRPCSYEYECVMHGRCPFDPCCNN